jgi:hypothetical protein
LGRCFQFIYRLLSVTAIFLSGLVRFPTNRLYLIRFYFRHSYFHFCFCHSYFRFHPAKKCDSKIGRSIFLTVFIHFHPNSTCNSVGLQEGSHGRRMAQKATHMGWEESSLHHSAANRPISSCSHCTYIENIIHVKMAQHAQTYMTRTSGSRVVCTHMDDMRMCLRRRP